MHGCDGRHGDRVPFGHAVAMPRIPLIALALVASAAQAQSSPPAPFTLAR